MTGKSASYTLYVTSSAGLCLSVSQFIADMHLTMQVHLIDDNLAERTPERHLGDRVK